ncbi:MAG: hypothetical protein GX608_04770, partial [Lentisphaerae bacterium]|nr:hypothetical protein [Lentisphaerota bacterium]
GLQWGRAFDGAEIPLGIRPDRAAGRFNGAAPLMARKYSRTSSRVFSVCLLQWGRAFDGAEIAQVVILYLSGGYKRHFDWRVFSACRHTENRMELWCNWLIIKERE